jgi:hypothetical protein
MGHMRPLKWRFRLPAVLGCATAGLMAWEQWNARVIESMGMRWDTGAPMWPFQTPEIILAVLNAPAYFIAAPIWWTLNLQSAQQQHPVLLLASIGLWHLVGRGIDSCWFSRQGAPDRQSLRLLLIGVVAVAASGGARQMFDGARWWSKYGGLDLPRILILVRIVCFVPWCLAVAAFGARSAFRWRRH